MNKLLLIFALAASAYGSTLTYTTTCMPFSRPVVVVTNGGCFGSSVSLTSNETVFDLTFIMLPAYPPPCRNYLFNQGCGSTSMVASFSDDIYFSETGFASFYLTEVAFFPGGLPSGFPFGYIDGQLWATTVIRIPVGPDLPVQIAFSADWMGQCCIDGGDDASVEFDITKIQFTDSNGNVSPSTYDTASGLTYPVIGGVLVPEPASVLLCALGFGILAVLRRRLASA
jgi:hypothetical protein